MRDFWRLSGIPITVFRGRLEEMMAMPNPDLDSIAAGWLAMLLVSTLFIDKSTRVNTNVLPLLYHTAAIGEYSWASWILACLYRGLGEGTRTFAQRIDGSTYLLHVCCYVCIFFNRCDRFARANN